MNGTDTIAAIATAPGEGALSVIRVSGPRALSIADMIFSCPQPPPSRRPGGTFVFGRVMEADGRVIDEAILLIMRAPRSYTREDTVEIQGHGGAVIARRILNRVLSAGARLAEPGEFTKRAFLNGRLDLAQAEAVADLIRARSDRAAAAAVEQLRGALSQQIETIYHRLLKCAAEVEATLDFSDQEIPFGILDPLQLEVEQCLSEIRALLATWHEGHLLREGAIVAIAGQPNVGKSTLLNALLGRDRAIVSPLPGTTRDVIEEQSIFGGYPIRLVDTAGLRPTDCLIEREGIRRAEEVARNADICLYVIDATVGPDDEDRRMLAQLPAERVIRVFNKVDLLEGTRPGCRDGGHVVYTSAKSGAGLHELRMAIVRLLDRDVPTMEPHAVISTRHRLLLEQALAAGEQALRELAMPAGASELVAAWLREAAEHLGKITGRVYYEDLLNSIFSRFCIGK